MKFICSSDILKKEVEIASNFSSHKNNTTMSGCIHFENNNDVLVIKCSDQKIGFISTINIQTIVPGTSNVFSDKLLDVLKNMPNEIDLEFSEQNNKLTITPVSGTKKSSITLNTQLGEKYPNYTDTEEENYFSIPQKDFNQMIDKTSFAIATEQTRVALTGVFFEKKEDNTLVMVATDGRRLAHIKKKMEQEVPDFPSVIIPDKFLKIIKSITTDEGLISLAITEANIYAKVGHRIAFSTLINGSYPNYERVIPKELKYSCTMKVADLESAFNLVSVLADTQSKRIFFDINIDGVVISSESKDFGSSKEVISCEYNGPATTIYFNSSLIQTPIKKIDTEFMKIAFNNSSAALVFLPEPERDYLYVLMPMQV